MLSIVIWRPVIGHANGRARNAVATARRRQMVNSADATRGLTPLIDVTWNTLGTSTRLTVSHPGPSNCLGGPWRIAFEESPTTPRPDPAPLQVRRGNRQEVREILMSGLII
jgi:hypothetical protein